jgi:hypothetical protein
MNEAAASALLQAFADPQHRSAAADALARALGGRRVLLCVRDAELGTMLPAPGLPKTVAAGPGWRDFLRRCLTEPRPAARIDFPDLGEVTAQACCHEGACIVVLGDEVPASALDALAPSRCWPRCCAPNTRSPWNMPMPSSPAKRQRAPANSRARWTRRAARPAS